MTQRVTLLACYALFVLSVTLGLLGWRSLWSSGLLSKVWSERTAPYIIAFAAVQLLAWMLLILLLRRFHRGVSQIPSRRVLGMMLGLLFGNVLYDFTLTAVAVVHFILAVLTVEVLRMGNRVYSD